MYLKIILGDPQQPVKYNVYRQRFWDFTHMIKELKRSGLSLYL